jgi:hypothetical protein
MGGWAFGLWPALVALACGPSSHTRDEGGVVDGEPRVDAVSDGDLGALVASPAMASFTSACGVTSSPATITIENTTRALIGPLATAVAGSDPADFVITADACSGEMLAPGGTCTVILEFRPTEVSARSALLSVTAGPYAASVALNGDSGSGLISIAPRSASFGSIAVGTRSATVTFTVTGVGSCGAGVLAVSLGGPGAPQWLIARDGCSGAELSSGSCEVDVAMEPASTGMMSAELFVAASPGGAAAAELRGTGI